VSIIGGGKNPIPGEITLAHHGVLFLDELTEFHNNVVQSLRQPMEAGSITVARADARVTYPARFMLVASMNPCPCGYLFEPEKKCRCTPSQLARYFAKVSGPILDRIDIQVEVKALAPFEITAATRAPESDRIRRRVEHARERQRERLAPFGECLNSRMDEELVKRYCGTDGETLAILRAAVERYGISARAYYKLLRVSRTIADMEGRGEIRAGDVLEALSYREFGNRYYGSSIAGHHTIF
jgi:magnesium chelatase family protein